MPDTEAELVAELEAHLSKVLGKTLYVSLSRADADHWPPPLELVMRHVKYMSDLEARGIVFAAGPFVNEQNERLRDGLVIVRADSVDEAAAIIADDPFHSGGHRTFELNRWSLNQGNIGVHVRFSNAEYTLD